MFKRFFAALTAVTIILAMAACGGNETKRPDPELTEDGKKIVRVYTMYSHSEMQEDITLFNKFNNEYEVQLTELSSEYGDPIDQFNAAVAAGKYPDVIMYNKEGQFPIESYAQKGMLADFYELIDNDPDLSREDFSDVFKAFEWDGKLYRIFTSFCIYTAAGKTSVVGEEQGLTVDRVIELMEKCPDSPYSDEPDGVLSTFMTYGYENFIDTAKGECRFNSEEFIKLLEFCAQIPTVPEAKTSTEFQEAQRKRVYAMRSGTMPFYTINFSTFSEIRAIEQRDFYDPVTFIGLPGAGGNGTVIEPVIYKFSVLANSANPEGGWEFVKYLLTGNRQDRLVKHGPFAVKRSALEAQAKEAQKLVWDSDEQDYVEPYCFDYTFSSNESPKKITIGANTDEDNQRVYDLISGAVELKYDPDVINIIIEEAGAYFSGQKSAKEVAEIIQNRVQNYLDENR